MGVIKRESDGLRVSHNSVGVSIGLCTQILRLYQKMIIHAGNAAWHKSLINRILSLSAVALKSGSVISWFSFTEQALGPAERGFGSASPDFDDVARKFMTVKLNFENKAHGTDSVARDGDSIKRNYKYLLNNFVL
jgi:hypothetical protein